MKASMKLGVGQAEWIAREISKLSGAELTAIQKFIDDNNIYRVEFGHYEGIKWIPLKTHRINIMEVLNGNKNR